MKLAIIILNYFGHQDTFQCIESVLSELKDATIFLIDNSNDMEEQRLLTNKYQTQENIKIFFPIENLGFAAGVNLGIREALLKDFDSFFILNNDTTIVEGLGRELTSALQSNPSSLIAMNINWAGNNIGLKHYHPYLGLLSDQAKKEPWIPFFTGCSITFDKTLLKEVGYLNESFFMYGEDIEFSLKVKEKNLPFVLLDKKNWINHKGSKSAKVASFFYEYHVARGHYLLTKSTSNALLLTPFKFVIKATSLSARALLRSIRFKSLRPIAGFLCSPFALKIRPR